MLAIKELFSKILERFVDTTIVIKEYDLGVISITAGTIGTCIPQNGSNTISTNVAQTGYTPIGVKTRFVNASTVGFCSFFSSDNSTLYTQVIRRTSSAVSNTYHLYVDVVYQKTSVLDIT